MNSRIKEDVQKIFEFWCEVTKTEGNRDNKQSGVIIESFPESFRDEQIVAKIPDFAYPCEFENNAVQSYSFVLTSDDSKWRFGFCRHDPKKETAMVLISYLPWHDTFLRFLMILGELRRLQNGSFESFLSEAYNKGVPKPGASLKLFYNSGQNHFSFQRPSQFQLPSIPQNHNLNLYYNFVDPKNMIAVFAAMLAERRIVFISKRLDRLSACIQAANAFLYPMVWQHIFIPILPMKMKDILSAPMPYLIGAPEAVFKCMTPEELGEVVVLNCDSKEFESPFDDVHQMPSELVSQMKKQLNNSTDHIGDRVSRIFLSVLVQLIGGYRDAVDFSQKKRTWNRDEFIETRPMHLRPFLTRMMELQIFQQFIDDRLHMLSTGLEFSDEFELETLRHAEKMGKRGKNYKDFLKNVKDRTNPAVKSAVKSVKEGSRGMKTAYKDLKSKLRDITPPKSHFHSHISSTSINNENFSSNPLHHRSAPNSPVFTKRSLGANSEFVNLDIGGFEGSSSNRKHSFMSASNSQVGNGFTSYIGSLSGNKSPTISPSSSVCSSEMNISQELQNHPLFKSPTVDRTLKPSNSLDYSGYRAARFGGPPITTPSPQHHKITAPIFEVPMGNLCIIDDDEHSNHDGEVIMENSSIPTTDSLFDSPPDMPSPPVPPKRVNGTLQGPEKPPRAKENEKKSHVAENQSITSSIGGRSGFENNFVNAVPSKHFQSLNGSNGFGGDGNGNDKIAHTEGGKPLISSQNTFIPQNIKIPVPTPRQKNKESPSRPPLPSTLPPKLDMDRRNYLEKDLITLDDSFDLEDFDPLNLNARPLPLNSSKTTTKSTNSPVTQEFSSTTSSRGGGRLAESSSNFSSINNNGKDIPAAVHNPLYPYFTPQHKNYSTERKEDDFELLKKYGLDQFTLTNGFASLMSGNRNTDSIFSGSANNQSNSAISGISTKISTSSAAASSLNRDSTNTNKKWTTFD